MRTRTTAVFGSFLTLAVAMAARAQDLGPIDLQLADVPNELPGHMVAPRPPGVAKPPQPKPEPAPAEPTARDWFGFKPIWEWERVTGDWAGARTSLEERGLTFAGSYTFEWSSVWDGGLKRGASTRSLLDLNMTLSLEKAFSWRGGTVYIDFYSTDGRGGNLDVGALQGPSNLETDANVDQIAEAWFEQVFGEGGLRVKFGKIDANSEFAFIESAGEFLNASAGVHPTIIGIPTYPDPAMGVVVQGSPLEWLTISGGFFDGASAVDGVATGRNSPVTFFSSDRSDDYFLIGEVAAGWAFEGQRTGHIGVGLWHHTGEFEKFDGGTTSGTTGFYAMLDQRLAARDEADAESDRGLYVFGQFGYASEEVSEIHIHVAAGVSLLGTFPGRDADAAGLYVSYAGISDKSGLGEYETAFELFYRLQLTPWASIKPDIQFIVNPGGDSGIDDALVGSLRFEVVF